MTQGQAPARRSTLNTELIRLSITEATPAVPIMKASKHSHTSAQPSTYEGFDVIQVPYPSHQGRRNPCDSQARDQLDEAQRVD